jgi:hypothetical protein
MKIPAGSTGRMDKPRKAAPVREKREQSEKSEASEKESPVRQKRERVRTKKFSS